MKTRSARRGSGERIAVIGSASSHQIWSVIFAVPLYDDHPARRTAVVNQLLIGVVRRRLFVAARPQPAPDSVRLRNDPGGAVRFGPARAVFAHRPGLGDGLHQHVLARRVVSPDRQHAVLVDLRQRRRGWARAFPLSRPLPGERCRGGADPRLVRSRLACADDRRERRHRRRARGLCRCSIPAPTCTSLFGS